MKTGLTIFYPPYIFSKLSTDIALEESGWRTRHEAGSEAGLRIAPTSCGCPAQLGCCEKERGERTRRGERVPPTGEYLTALALAAAGPEAEMVQ